MSKCGRCGENVYHCLCDGGAGNKNTPPLVRKALIAELERDEAIENAEHWKKQAMLKEDALTIQRKRDRFEAAKEFVAALIPVVSTCKEEGTQIRFDCPDALFSIAWDMADRFLLAELDKEAPVKPEPAKEPQPTHRFKVGDKVKIVRSTPWRSGKSGEHTECVGCTGTLKQPSMRIIDFDVELDEKHDGLLTAGCMSADLELIKAAPQPVIEFGDIVRVVSISDSRFGIRQDAYNIGLVGVWGKCTQAGWDGCINDLDCFMYDDLELVSKAPEPHVWSVGDYALCPDGKVRRVKEVSIQDLSFHDSTWEPKKDCTPCPEPEMPRWRGFDGCMEFFLRPDGNLMSSDYKYDAPIPKWLDFLPDKYQSTKKYLIALRDWRALTGRMV